MNLLKKKMEEEDKKRDGGRSDNMSNQVAGQVADRNEQSKDSQPTNQQSAGSQSGYIDNRDWMTKVGDFRTKLYDQKEKLYKGSRAGMGDKMSLLRSEGISDDVKEGLARDIIMAYSPDMAKEIESSGGKYWNPEKSRSSGIPYGVDPEKQAKFNNAKIDKAMSGKSANPLDTLEKVMRLRESNIDIVDPTQPADASLDSFLTNLSDQITGGNTAETKQRGNIKSLAEQVSSSPQETGRSWWDDTISPDAVKQKANNYVDMLVGSGMNQNTARNKVKIEYSNLMAEDNGMFRKYPDMDIGKLFLDQDNRAAAIDGQAAVVDVGDGVDTTPTTFQDIGLSDPDTMEQFSALEEMTKGGLPDGMDLKTEYQKNPNSYTKLFKAIKEGVPDGQGGTRKLSREEILRVINSMGS